MISREEHTEGEKHQLKGVCFGLSLGTNSVLGLNIHIAGGKSPQHQQAEGPVCLVTVLGLSVWLPTLICEVSCVEIAQLGSFSVVCGLANGC